MVPITRCCAVAPQSGCALRSQGRYTDAEPLFKRALTISEKALGPDHPDVAVSLNNLAGLYQPKRATRMLNRLQTVVDNSEKALGPNHPNVAFSLNNLAALYASQGRYADAEPLLKRALAVRETVLGPSHPDVAASVNNLASFTEPKRATRMLNRSTNVH